MRLSACLICFLIFLSSLPHAYGAGDRVLIAADSISNYYSRKQGFNGGILILQKGRPFYKKAMGIACREQNSQIDTAALFRLCSVTKTFTAIIIMQLWQQGLLDPQDMISTYLPEYKGTGGKSITIQNLLTYSSGLSDQDQKSDEMYLKPLSPAQIIERFASGALLEQPGTQFRYKNIDFILLGKIIEYITGDTYAHALQKYILRPLKMNSTFLAEKNDQSICAYTVDSTGLINPEQQFCLANFGAAGALISTLHDMELMDAGLWSGKLLDKKRMEYMLKPYPQLWSVAIGFWVSDITFREKKYRAADRRGAIGGMQVHWYHLIEPDLTIFLYSNTDQSDLVKMRDDFVHLLLEAE
jgi:CubicO group peptidase (beta-lactamase class C family)